MSDVRHDTSADPDPRIVRRVRLLRAGVLLVIGLVIAFSAPLHEQIEFVRWALLTSFLALAVASFVEYGAFQHAKASRLIAFRGIIAAIAAIKLVFPTDESGLAAVVAIWALLTALVTLLRVIMRGQARSTGLPSALLSAGLAVTAMVARDDVVALLGFFGAYAILRAVFLGISAFDARATAAPNESDASATLGDDATTTGTESTA